MPVLYKASFSYLLRHPWQLGLALSGICIGVAVMVAVDLANDSSRKAFLLSMDKINGAATHQIIGGPSGVDENIYVRLRVEQGIRSIAPVVTGSADVGGNSMQVLGVDLFAERTFRSYTFPGATSQQTGSQEGRTNFDESSIRRFLTEPGAAMMSTGMAAAMNLSISDEFHIQSGGKRHRAILVGLVDSGEQSGTLDSLLVVDIATAQRWFEKFGYLSRIDVRLTDDESIADSIRSALPPDSQLLSAESRTQSTTEMSAAFMTNLTAMSLLALLIGTFLIYNSVSFAVLQRRGLIGVLRALGLTRRQTFLLILGESLLLGVVGAGLGVALGIYLGEELLALVSQSINDLYFRVSVTDVAVSPIALLTGIVAGVVVTGLAAVIPAFEASGYKPQLSLTRSVLEHRTRLLLPRIALMGLATVITAIVVLQFSGSSLIAGLAALFMLILGFSLCIPLAVNTLVRLSSGLAERLGGTTARLAVNDIGASLSRTGVAIVALAVAVSATVGVSIMVDSFRVAVGEWIGNTLQSDIYVGAPGGSLDQSLIDEFAGLEGVEEISSTRRFWLENPDGRTRVVVLNLSSVGHAGTQILDADPADVWPAFEAEGAVIVSEPYAYRNNVGRGDFLDLTTRDGPRTFEIAATYRSYDANQGTVLMSGSTYVKYWDDDAIDSIGIYLAQGASSNEVITRMQEVSQGRQSVFIRSNRELREMSLRIFDRTFIITDVLYWLAVAVAVIGILGSMLALQLERARELAILRALGMTPLQLGSMVTLQTGLIGLLSGLAALPLGLLMAWILIDVINRRSFGWQMDMSIAPSFLVNALALSVVAALLAGLYPAYRAASSNPAMAMREE